MFTKKSSKDKEIKKELLKRYFNSRNHKKIIMEAAKKAAKDQDILLAKYHKLLNS